MAVFADSITSIIGPSKHFHFETASRCRNQMLQPTMVNKRGEALGCQPSLGVYSARAVDCPAQHVLRAMEGIVYEARDRSGLVVHPFRLTLTATQALIRNAHNRYLSPSSQITPVNISAL